MRSKSIKIIHSDDAKVTYTCQVRDNKYTYQSCIYLFWVLRRFQHCTGHITTGSWKGRGNQYIEFARVVYCKMPNNGKQLPGFPLKAVTGIEPRPQRWEARVLPYQSCNTAVNIKVWRGFHCKAHVCNT